MEQAFKILFFLAIFFFCVLVIGLFLLGVKIVLLFTGDFDFFGIHFSGLLSRITA